MQFPKTVVSYYTACMGMVIHDISLEPCRNLMAKQDMTELGFGNLSQANLSGDKLEQL